MHVFNESFHQSGDDTGKNNCIIPLLNSLLIVLVLGCLGSSRLSNPDNENDTELTASAACLVSAFDKNKKYKPPKTPSPCQKIHLLTSKQTVIPH